MTPWSSGRSAAQPPRVTAGDALSPAESDALVSPIVSNVSSLRRAEGMRGAEMSEPFVYVGTWTIKPGKEAEARKYLAEHAAFIEKSEPRLIAFQVYFNEAG